MKYFLIWLLFLSSTVSYGNSDVAVTEQPTVYLGQAIIYQESLDCTVVQLEHKQSRFCVDPTQLNRNRYWFILVTPDGQFARSAQNKSATVAAISFIKGQWFLNVGQQLVVITALPKTISFALSKQQHEHAESDLNHTADFSLALLNLPDVDPSKHNPISYKTVGAQGFGLRLSDRLNIENRTGRVVFNTRSEEEPPRTNQDRTVIFKVDITDNFGVGAGYRLAYYQNYEMGPALAEDLVFESNGVIWRMEYVLGPAAN